MALPTLEVRQHAVIAPAQPGDVRVSASVGPDGEVIALWSAAADVPALTATTNQPGWATFPDPRTPRPVVARVKQTRGEHLLGTRGGRGVSGRVLTPRDLRGMSTGVGGVCLRRQGSPLRRPGADGRYRLDVVDVEYVVLHNWSPHKHPEVNKTVELVRGSADIDV